MINRANLKWGRAGLLLVAVWMGLSSARSEATVPVLETAPIVSQGGEAENGAIRQELLQRRVAQGTLRIVPEPVPVATSSTPDEVSQGRDLLTLDQSLLLAAEDAAPVIPTDLAAAPIPNPAPSEAVPTSAKARPSTAPSQNLTINLINRMVKRGLISAEDAEALIMEAQEDVVIAQAQAQSQGEPIQTAASGGGSGASAGGNGGMRITYIPEVVKNQIRADLKQEMLDQAREENWAGASQVPDWVSRFRLFGDLRARYEFDFFPSENAVGFGSNFWNFNAINTGSPFDFTNATANPPFYNVDEDRNRARLRARFGTEVDLTQGLSAGLRLATGENNSPTSTNQSLGATTQGQGGNFSKYAIWLDRAFIRYEAGAKSEKSFAASVGRFDNPFFSTEMVWDDDVGFDGVAVSGKYKVADGFTPFGTLGAFPVYNTDFNFSSNQPTKFESQDKWLYGTQVGTDWKITEDVSLKVAAAYYHFQDIEGQVSNPYVPLTSSDAGSTDGTRPAFAQKGNTYIALRNIRPDASNGFGTTNQFQYFGLATPFQLGVLTARLDVKRFDPFHIWVTGEGVKNLAFDKDEINRNGPSNLSGPVNNNGASGSFEGGSLGGFVRLNVGKPSLEKLWDWNFNLGYRYVESDAVVDGFTDSDFGGGGTNLQGYTIGANVGFNRYFSGGLRYMSAESIAGPVYNEDIIQLELNAKF